MDVSKIDYYIGVGAKDKNWYQLAEYLFIDLFGHDKLKLVTQLFAATSINTSLKANITLFRRALYEIENNKPIGKYLPNIIKQLEQVRAGKELTGRKINSFANAMAGDVNAVVVDIWLLRAFDEDRKYYRKPTDSKRRGSIRSSGATSKQYDIIEAYVRDKAISLNLQPRELSAMIWSGVRIDQSGDTETHYETLLRYHFNNLFQVI